MKQIESKHPDYIQVTYKKEESYGGSQLWFDESTWMSRDYKLHKWGCGVIALGDLFLYIGRNDKNYRTNAIGLIHNPEDYISWEDYRKYIHYINSRFAQIIPGSGMNGLMLASAVRHYCMKFRLQMTIAWKAFMDDQQMIRVIHKMLNEDLPVILAIGPNTPLVFRGKGIPFYQMEENGELVLSGYKNVHSHYVTVTGMVRLKHKKVMLRISSWGKEFYIDYQEYREYIEKEGDRFTSSLLYLSKEDKKIF